MTNQSAKFIATAFLALGVSSAAVAQKPTVSIEKVRAYGDGCNTDVNGKPKNFSVTVNKDDNVFSIDYADFIIDSRKLNKSCKISMILAFPQGQTLYSYKSQVMGEAVVEGNEKVKITTAVRLGKDSFKEVYTIPKGTDGDFETKAYEFKSKKEAPCGGKDYRITIDLKAEIKGGKESFVSVESSDGKLANMSFKTKNCK